MLRSLQHKKAIYGIKFATHTKAKEVYSRRQIYLLSTISQIFYKELQLQKLEYEYFDDIYPSILKLQASHSRGFLLNICFYCKSLCNKAYSTIRLFCIHMFSRTSPT